MAGKIRFGRVCGKVQIFGNEADHQNGVNEEIERRLNSGKACLWKPCHCAVYRERLLAFGLEVLSSRFLCKNVNPKIHKSVSSVCCLVWAWTYFHIRDRLYAAGVPQYGTEKLFWPEREQVTWDWRKLRNYERHHLGIQTGEGELGKKCGSYGREEGPGRKTESNSLVGRSRIRYTDRMVVWGLN